MLRRLCIFSVMFFIVFISSAIEEEKITTKINLDESSEEADDEYPEISCPAVNPKHPVFLPHPTNCRKFFICDSGIPHPKTCTSSLHFNPKVSACDFPANSGCDSNDFVTPKKKDNKETGLNVDCPSESKNYPVLLPHETDCEKFYICSGGIPHLSRCQLGTHFNPKLQVCDFPNRAQCDNAAPLASDGFPSPFCPSVNGKHPIFYRHPSNCSVYYMCGNGLAYEFVCPSRLHFNLRKKVCDYEWNAKCQSG
ncbi:Peritrophin-1, partial [Stegodyphus mimosarum]